MGEKDITEKILEDYNDVFADIINGLLFQGEQRVLPEALENISVHSQYKADDEKMHELERDVAKYWKEKEVQLAVNEFGQGRCVYISGLPYSFRNSRVLYRAVLWSASAEDELNRWYSTNYNVEVHAYVKNGKYCVVNNTYESQDTVVYKGDGSSFPLHMDANEIKWYQI